MTDIFLGLLNISITVSYLIVAVIVVRSALKKAPQWISGVLWAMVGIRLLIPFSIKSVFSLIPSTNTIPEDIAVSESPSINSGFAYLNQMVNPIISESFAPTASETTPMEKLLSIAFVVWAVGVVAMLIYGMITYFKLRRSVSASLKINDNIYYCDDVDTPFILGVFRPRIYLPSSISEDNALYVIAHEKAHIKRGDHFWKPLGFVILSVHWFNPLMWVAYILLCRDIEKACDEKVVKDMELQGRKGYSEALLSCRANIKIISSCPLAFGEVNVKERVRSVLNYKKARFLDHNNGVGSLYCTGGILSYRSFRR